MVLPDFGTKGLGVSGYPIAPAGLKAVSLTDAFWRPRLEVNRRVTVPYCLAMARSSGAIDNFARAAGLLDGDATGLHNSDEVVYKTIEAASYTLGDAWDAGLDAELDAIIATIVAAQEADGYLVSRRTLALRGDPKGPGRWSDLGGDLELYLAGHLYEAAVAHYEATGKRVLLDVAMRNADLVDRLFGPGKRVDVGGHPEVELALMRLFEATGRERYQQLAEFFVETRGTVTGGRRRRGPFSQDHVPIRDQMEAVGQAPRAAYFYSGVADVAAATGDHTLVEALERLWRDVIGSKLYITGGIGSRHENEGFGAPYELPNLTGYSETCAAVALAMWAVRMFRLSGSADYLDVLERTLYNNLVAGVSLSGDRFFYSCPMASNGRFGSNVGWTPEGYCDPYTTPSVDRKPWFACACCPPNVARWLPQIPGLVYATGDAEIYVNLYAAGSARVVVGGHSVTLRQTTQYPWDGIVHLCVEPADRARLCLNLRIPGWARGTPVPSTLYRFVDKRSPRPAIWLNGNRVPAAPVTGYVRLERLWESGDVVSLELPMPIRRLEAHASVAADRGKVALQRGPLVYCAEGIDHGGRALDLVLPDAATLHAVKRPDLLGGVTLLTGTALRAGQPVPFTAIPYAVWGNRGPGEMTVWLDRDPVGQAPPDFS